MRMCWAVTIASSQPSPLQSGKDLQVAKPEVFSKTFVLLHHYFLDTCFVHFLQITYKKRKKKKREWQ